MHTVTDTRSEDQRLTALIDVYVLTQRLGEIMEDRLEAIQRAVSAGASVVEIAQARDGSL